MIRWEPPSLCQALTSFDLVLMIVIDVRQQLKDSNCIVLEGVQVRFHGVEDVRSLKARKNGSS